MSAMRSWTGEGGEGNWGENGKDGIDLRFAAEAVAASDWGIVRTVSMMWITPPVKLIFCDGVSELGTGSGEGDGKETYRSNNRALLEQAAEDLDT